MDFSLRGSAGVLMETRLMGEDRQVLIYLPQIPA